MSTYDERARRVGERIARKRVEAGISQISLSRMVGFSHSHMSRIESGEKVPNVTTLLKIADALGVDVIYFFTDI